MCRVVQNRIYTPYMTVYLVISLPHVPYMHRIYMVLANPSYVLKKTGFMLPEHTHKNSMHVVSLFAGLLGFGLCWALVRLSRSSIWCPMK